MHFHEVLPAEDRSMLLRCQVYDQLRTAHGASVYCTLSDRKRLGTVRF